MKIFLVRKKKGKVYSSEAMVSELFGVKLSHGEAGEPVIPDGFISISDTRTVWAACVSSSPVGIDIEELSRNVRASAAGRLSLEERDYLSALSPESGEWREEFLSIWTRKEALSKLAGLGMRMDFRSFSVLGRDDVRSFKKGGLMIAAAGEGCGGAEAVERECPGRMEKSALDAGASMLDAAYSSESALIKKLERKGYLREEAEKAAGRLRETGLINDRVYGESYAEKLARQGRSSARIRLELERKGVPPDLSRELSEPYREGDRERAGREALKIPDPAKAARRLSALGYEASVIYDIINRLNSNLD